MFELGQHRTPEDRMLRLSLPLFSLAFYFLFLFFLSVSVGSCQGNVLPMLGLFIYRPGWLYENLADFCSFYSFGFVNISYIVFCKRVRIHGHKFCTLPKVLTHLLLLLLLLVLEFI